MWIEGRQETRRAGREGGGRVKLSGWKKPSLGSRPNLEIFGCLIFNESAPRPIQSTIRNVRVSVCLRGVCDHSKHPIPSVLDSCGRRAYR